MPCKRPLKSTWTSWAAQERLEGGGGGLDVEIRFLGIVQVSNNDNNEQDMIFQRWPDQ